MSKPCAQPVCGHSTDDHAWDSDGKPICRAPDGRLKVTGDRLLCPCPSFRTPDQQEAWEALRQWPDGGNIIELQEIARCLLELHP